MKKTIITLFLFFVTISIFANGIIRGTVIDASSGEPIINVNVIVEGTSIGATTDFDGIYSLKIKEGTYTITVTSLGYASVKIENVIVVKDDVKSLGILLDPSELQLDEVVITSSGSTKRTATALLTMQKKSTKLLDGISSESISKNGDSDVASALKRVTGISVEGGKYVYVRGLSDRYTKTTFNGVAIPGLDPDKNTVQMDLFPTNLIDNLVVYKTFSPDLPGDFTGGLVDITTKDFPRRKTFVVSLGYGLTSNMNFNKDFVLYKQGGLDWLGFGNNSRKLGFNANTVIPDESLNDPNLTNLTNSFSKELGVTKGANSFLDQNFSVSFGNQYEKEKVVLGLNLALNYANTYKYYDDVIQGVFFKDTDVSQNNLDKREITRGSLGENNVIWSGLIGGSMKFEKSKYAVSLFHSQNGTGQAADYISQNFDETNATLYKDAIQYSQKSVTNLIVKGNHRFNENKLKIDWKLSPTYSSILEPDVRSTRLSFDSDTNTFELQLGDGAGIDRYYRTLNEINMASKIDVTYKFEFLSDANSKLKFGLANTYKTRDYEILAYRINKTSDFNNFTEDPNTILLDANIWNATSQSGVYIQGFQDLNNQYKSTSNNIAGYVMNEVKVTDKLKTAYGVRLENATIDYEGYFNSQVFNKRVHNELVVLPSLNFIYALTDNANLRISYSKTVARPSFKEKSNAHIFDPISQNLFIGNLNLKETNIENIDLRWENFFKSSEMISISGFYKKFINPIEIVPFQLSPNNIQPKNAGSATVYGGEFEIKKLLSKEEAKLNFSIGANFTYIVSTVDTKKVTVNTSGKTEYELRQENARDTEIIDQYRTMQGQSPYIVNGSLNLYNENFDANLSYNVQGEKLAIVGSGIVPDVFEGSYYSLNFKTSYKFGTDSKYKLSFSVKNLLDDNFEQYFDSYKSSQEIYRSYSKKRSFSLSFNYTIY
ncbi:MAG: TonB-dependent receptor [Lutibacter sp.]|nr:MAG: TonB-dependent receptor [Lutibacter sp.]